MLSRFRQSMKSLSTYCATALLLRALFALWAVEGRGGQDSAESAGIEFFEAKIRPLLADRCFPCHSARNSTPPSGLYLDSRQALLKGGQRGPAIVPGDPAQSLLIQAIRYGVMVNRIWLHHFGAGLVRTPSDFGFRSEPPSHPEPLDYLARRFMEEGWSIKKLHRLIMLSSVYRQSSDENPERRRLDPENTLRSMQADVPNHEPSGDPRLRSASRVSRIHLCAVWSSAFRLHCAGAG